MHEGLKSLAKTALSTCVKTESMIITELQQTTDLKETHKKLDQDIEAHHITQGFDSDNVFLPQPFHRGAGTKKDLHFSNQSVVKPHHRKKHSEVRIRLLQEHFKTRQLEDL